jgi:hypothetical protein
VLSNHTMDVEGKFKLSLNTAKKQVPRPSTQAVSITGTKDDLQVAQTQHKQFVLGVSEQGKLVHDPSAPSSGGNRLVIPLPAPFREDSASASVTASGPDSSAVPTHLDVLTSTIGNSVNITDLDARAAQEILEDLSGTRKKTSTLVIPTASASAIGTQKGISDYTPAVERKRGDTELLHKLFAPTQQRIKSDGHALPLLLRNRPTETQPSDVSARRYTDDKSSLQADLRCRADDVDIVNSEAFERVPIDEFGAAMLRGMGVADEDLEDAMHGGAKTSTSRAFTREKLGVGASSNPLLALKLADDNRIRKPGEARPSSAPVTQSAASGLPSKVAKSAAIHERKYPGLVVDAKVVVREALRRVGVVTQTDGVPGLERCRLRVFGQPTLDALVSGSSALRQLTLEDTEEIIVRKSSCVVGELSINEEPQAEHLARLQKQFVQAKLKASAPPAIPGASTAADVEAVGRTTNSIIAAGASTHHTGEPTLPDEVHRLRSVEEYESKTADSSSKLHDGRGSSKYEATSSADPTNDASRERRHGSRLQSRSRSPHHHRQSSRYGERSRSRERPRNDTGDRHRRHSPESRRRDSRERARRSSPVSSRASEMPHISNWLLPGIRVRIVDAAWQGGRWFKQKATVHDVESPGVCTLSIDSERGRPTVVSHVAQSMLATALPKPGGHVRIVRGKYRGSPGTLLERHADRQAASIQLHGDYEGDIVTISYDDTAEAVGQTY